MAVDNLDKFISNLNPVDFDTTGPWDDFDKIYLVLHRMAVIDFLLNGSDKSELRNANLFETARKKDYPEIDYDSDIVSIEYLLDFDLSIKSERIPFISEFDVKSIIDFRNSFSQHIDFYNFIKFLNLGCVELSFDVCVPVPSIYGKGKERHQFTKEAIDERLSMPHWKALTGHFNVLVESVK